MTKEKPLVLLLVLCIIFNTLFYNSMNVSTKMILIQDGYAHSFTSNNYAKFISSIDEFQTESKLVYDNLKIDNSSLAEKHAAEAFSIFSWDLMTEAEERDKKVSDEIKTAIENLMNISSNISNSPPADQTDSNKQKQIEKAIQLVRVINANTNIMINNTESQQQTEGSNPLNQFVALLTNFFTGQKDNNDANIQPMRFVEVADSILRNYGDAFNVDFDMTDMSYMSNMTNMSNSQPMVMSNESEDNNQNRINSTENAADYQTAMGLSEKLLEIFEKELKPIMSTNETSLLSSNLQDGMLQLSSSIKDKASPEDIMMIVHTQIHPNLIKAFNLQILSDV